MNAVIKQVDLERVGSAYSPEKMLAVREMTRAAIHEIAAAVRPGMIEEDAVAMAKRLLAARGMLRGWHDVYVPFGPNTANRARPIGRGKPCRNTNTVRASGLTGGA